MKIRNAKFWDKIWLTTLTGKNYTNNSRIFKNRIVAVSHYCLNNQLNFHDSIELALTCLWL